MNSINYQLPYEAYFWFSTFPQASESVFQLAGS